MRAPRGRAVGVHTHALIEAIEGHTGVAAQLRRVGSEEAGFTGVRRSEDQGATYITDMKI